jgi:drug/metabolite transporter (DMT)-like permease
MNWRTSAAFALIGILWGSAWILAPLLPMSPLLAGAARLAIAAVMLTLVAFIARIRLRPPARTFPLVPSLLLGITMVGLPYALATWARDSVSAGVVAVLYALMPLAALFFSGDRVNARIPALAIGTGGIAFLVAEGITYSTAQIGGMLLIAAAVVLGAFSLNYAKSNIPKGCFLLSSAIQCAVACVLLVFLSGIEGWPRRTSWTQSSLLALTALAATEGAVALPLLFWLLSKLESWQAATLQWVATLAAVIEAGWFLRAKPTLQMSAGAVLVIGAIVWLMRSGDRPESDSGTVTLQITSSIQSRPQASDSRKE